MAQALTANHYCNEYTAADVVIDGQEGICPACQEKIKLGPGGPQNLIKTHLNTKTCRNAKAKRDRSKTQQQGLASFLRPKAATVPSTVSAPRPVIEASSASLGPTSSVLQPVSVPNVPQFLVQVPEFLIPLNTLIPRLPLSVPVATDDDTFAIAFSGSPANRIPLELENASGDILWEELVTKQLHSVFWGQEESDIKPLIRRGAKGVQAFSEYIAYFVSERGIDATYFHEQVDKTINAMKLMFTVDSTESAPEVSQGGSSVEKEIIGQTSPIDVDSPSDMTEHPCQGLHIAFPGDRNAYTDYPFLLHHERPLPWEVDGIMRGGKEMTLRAHACKRMAREGIKRCQPCRVLKNDGYLTGILARFNNSTHENTPLAYHGPGGMAEVVRRKDRQIQGLRFGKLNAAKQLHGITAALSDSKRLLLAIGSGDVKNPDRVLRRGLKNKRGIRGLLGMYMDAAKGIYKPRDDREETMLQGILLWRLGGIRVAELGHRALGLPSMTALRANSRMPPIIVSPSTPLIAEILHNLDACLASGLLDILKGITDTIHIVLMIDEVAVEKRIRWDSRTNKFVGVCREHGMNTCLCFNGEKDLEMLFESLEKEADEGGVHYASEATVAAIGILDSSKRLYSARPILVSGTCKREQAPEHAQLISLLITAVNHKMTEAGVNALVASVATDGETRRGSALCMLTMKHELSPDSPIYPLLQPLQFMDLRVGLKNLTVDKDYRHIFKRLRNLLLRDRGITILGQFIPASVLCKHLSDEGLSKAHLNAIFAPDDKQDVTLAYNLLHDTWSLPETSSNHPGYREARAALRILGKFFKFLLFPYACLELSLSEQLEHLSSAAWIAFLLFRDAEKGFLPNLLYTDIMIMIKNVFFSVAKVKVDNPDSKFYIILLGTDRLEALFGIVRSMVGNDSGCDLLQLAMRITGSTEIANIFAQYPHWDKNPRRLRLPALDKDGKRTSLPDNSDHVNPASWSGDTSVKNVNLQTCWKVGLSRLQNDSEISSIITEHYRRAVGHSKTATINILCPLGKDLVASSQEDVLDEPLDGSTPGLASNPNGSTPRNRINGAGFSVEIEDAAAEEDDENTSVEKRVVFDGKVINKARALALRSKYRTKAKSTDRLKRVQDVPRFNTSTQSTVDLHASPEGEVLLLNDPIASVLRSDDHLFLCIGELLSIQLESQTCEQVPVSLLQDKSISVTFQLLFLVPATVDDDPERKHDWRAKRDIKPAQFTVPGRLVLPLNPDTGLSNTGKLQYLFESSVLCSVAASFLDILSLQDAKSIQTFKNEHFPYRDAITYNACFVIESDTNHELPIHNVCPSCVPSVPLPPNPHQQLAHLGAHILFGSTNRSSEPCGACLSPWPLCQYYVGPRGKGQKRTIQITKIKNCKNPLPIGRFKYNVALKSSTSAPTSNIPIRCPLCATDDPAIWKYNLRSHFLRVHPDAALPTFEKLWELERAEHKRMKRVWDTRKDVPKSRKKKGGPKLTISKAHSSRLALRTNDLENSRSEDERDDEPNELVKQIGAMSGDSDDDFVVADGAASADEGESEKDDEEESAEESEHEESEEKDDGPDGGYAAESNEFDSLAASVMDSADMSHDSILAGKTTTTPKPSGSASSSSTTAHNIPDEMGTAEPQDGMRTRKRKRKENTDRTFECICGLEVLVEEQGNENLAVQCHGQGCETIWFHIDCLPDSEGFDKPNWKCSACRGSRKPRKRLRDS